MDDRHSSDSGEAAGEGLAKINSNLTQIVGGIWGIRWGLRFGSLLPAVFAGLFLYGGFTTYKGSQHMWDLINGFFFVAVVLGVLVWSVVGNFD